MITVRFPSGFSVQYNDARYLTWGVDGLTATLWTSRVDKEAGKTWIATVNVASGALIEFAQPCRTYFAATPNDAVIAEKRLLENKIQRLQKQLAKLKKGTHDHKSRTNRDSERAQNRDD